MFFAVEGPTGVGKSEVTTYLRDNLRSRLPGHIAPRIVFSKDSEGSPLAQQVRGLARSGIHELGCPKEQVLLFWTSRFATCKHLARLIQHGNIPIVERFGASTWAHQIYSHNRVHDLDEFHWDLVRHCVINEGLTPPHYLMLIAPASVLLERIMRREKVSPFPQSWNEDDKLAFLEQLIAGYRAYAEHPTQHATIIDASGSITDVAEQVIEVMVSVLNTRAIVAA